MGYAEIRTHARARKGEAQGVLSVQNDRRLVDLLTDPFSSKTAMENNLAESKDHVKNENLSRLY